MVSVAIAGLVGTWPLGLIWLSDGSWGVIRQLYSDVIPITWTSMTPLAISADGNVVTGYAKDVYGAYHAYVLDRRP